MAQAQEVICPGCKVPHVTVRAMYGEPWQECPFAGCPGHGRVGEPCWGDMRCYDEWGPDDDLICMLACNGHLSWAGDGTRADKPDYRPEGAET